MRPDGALISSICIITDKGVCICCCEWQARTSRRRGHRPPSQLPEKRNRLCAMSPRWGSQQFPGDGFYKYAAPPELCCLQGFQISGSAEVMSGWEYRHDGRLRCCFHAARSAALKGKLIAASGKAAEAADPGEPPPKPQSPIFFFFRAGSKSARKKKKMGEVYFWGRYPGRRSLLRSELRRAGPENLCRLFSHRRRDFSLARFARDSR